jgi:hypothetical protein
MSRDLLQSHVGPESPLVLGFNPITDSPWLPRNWKKTINHLIDRRDLPTESSGQFGGHSVYKLSKVAEKISKIQSKVTTSAITQSGGTASRFCEYVGFEMYDHIDLSYAGNPLQTLYGLQLYLWHLAHKRSDKRDAEATLVGGGGNFATPAQRNNTGAGKGTAAQTFYTDLPFFFTYETHNSFPILVLAEELRVEVYYKTIPQIVQSDAAVGNVTVTLTNQVLRVTYVHNIQKERDILKNGVNADQGILFPILDVERQPLYLIASGSSSPFQIKLTNPKSPCTYSQFIFRKNSNINTNNGNTFNTFENVSSYNIEANNNPLVREVEHDYQMFYLNPMYYDGSPDDHIYGHSWSLAPENKMDAHGSNYFGMQNNPIINVTFTSAPAENWYFDGFFYVHNFIQVKGPDVIKIFK